MRERLLVMQINGRVVTCLTDDGRFVRRRWTGALPAVGELASQPAPALAWPRLTLAPRLGLAAVALSVLLIVALQLPALAPLARASTIVAVDLIPSIEFTLTAKGTVASARPLNAEAEELLNTIGQLPAELDKTVELLIDVTAKAGKLTVDRENIVMVTAIPGWRGLPEQVKLSELQAKIVAQLEALGIPAVTRVATATRTEAAQAQQKGTTVNKLTVTKNLKATGKDVKIEETKDKNVQELVDDHSDDPEKAVGGKHSGPKKGDDERGRGANGDGNSNGNGSGNGKGKGDKGGKGQSGDGKSGDGKSGSDSGHDGGADGRDGHSDGGHDGHDGGH